MDKLYSKQLSVSLGLILIAFFLILIPDKGSFSLAYTDNFKPLINKYILAEILLLVSLFMILANSQKIDKLISATSAINEVLTDDTSVSVKAPTGKQKQQARQQHQRHYPKKKGRR